MKHIKKILASSMSVVLFWTSSNFAMAATAKPVSVDYSLPKNFDQKLCESVQKSFLLPKDVYEEIKAQEPYFSKEDAKFIFKLKSEANKMWKNKDIKVSCLPGSDLKFKFEMKGETPVTYELTFQKGNWVISWQDRSYSWNPKLSFQQNYEALKSIAMKQGKGSARFYLLVQEVYAIAPLAVAAYLALAAGATWAYDWWSGGRVCYWGSRAFNSTDEQATANCMANTQKTAIQDRIRSLYSLEDFQIAKMKCVKSPEGKVEAKFLNTANQEVVYMGKVTEQPVSISLAYAYLTNRQTGAPLVVSLDKRDKVPPWDVRGTPKSWAEKNVIANNMEQAVNARVYFAEAALNLGKFALSICDKPGAEAADAVDAKDAAKSYNMYMLALLNPDKAKMTEAGLRIEDETQVERGGTQDATVEHGAQ